MIAAIYARKSTSQDGKSEEEKSVTRQVERAKAFAASKGWTVAEEHIYVDDAISGAEFEARDGLMRLVASLKPKPPFSVLVVMDPDRLGREQCESPYWFKKINQAGVAIYEYLTGQDVRLDNPTDKLLISVSNFAAEMERVQASRRVKDAFLHKIHKGLVVGGKVFGYANVRTPEGVRREINPGEAQAVVRIFELCAQGFGYLRTAHRLNEEGRPSPGGRGWSPSSVRDVLHRPLYKGEIVWNKTAKKDRWGQRKVQRRPPDDWVHAPHAPELRIVSDELWERAHDRLRDSRDVYLQATRGQLWGKPGNGIESKYLLTGLAVCGVCGGALTARWKDYGKRRVWFYRCLRFIQRGRAVCPNDMALPMKGTDAAILATVEAELLRPEVVRGAVQEAVRRLQPPEGGQDAERRRLHAALKRIEEELARLTAAIAAGGSLETLVAAVQERERQREQLRGQLAALDALGDVARLDTARLEQTLKGHLAEWRGLLLKHTQAARQVIRKLVIGRVTFKPTGDGAEFEGEGRIEPLLMGTVLSKLVVPPG